jgi:hypothetical protein
MNGTYHGTDTLTVSTRQALSAEVETECHRNRETEIPDTVAMAIVAGWQAPSGVGRHFATLASTGHVSLELFADDLSATFDECVSVYGKDSAEWWQLCLLATWCLNHPSRES